MSASDPAAIERYHAAARGLDAARLLLTRAIDERKTAVDGAREERTRVGSWTEEGVDQMLRAGEDASDAVRAVLEAVREYTQAVAPLISD